MQWRACLFSCSSCLQSYKLPDVNHLLVWIDVICFTDVARIAETRVSSINDPVVCNWLVCWLWMLKESLFAQTAGHLFKIQSWKRTYAQSCSAASPLSWRILWPFTSPGDMLLPLASQTFACMTCTRVHCHQVQVSVLSCGLLGVDLERHINLEARVSLEECSYQVYITWWLPVLTAVPALGWRFLHCTLMIALSATSACV